MKKAIFFDLDGTLWDATEQIATSWNQTMEKLNKKYRFTKDIILTHMGLTPEETGPIAFFDETFKDSMDLFYKCVHSEIIYLRKHPGIPYDFEEKVLEILSKKYDLYIVSNADKGYIQNYLYGLNMHKYFKDFVQYGDTSLPKWKNILYMKDKHQIDKVIYVGDTIKDKNECDLAHVLFVHAKYGFGKIDDEQYYINSLLDLERVADKLFNL